MPETQFEAAQRLYGPRASTYDDTWHRTFAPEFVKLASIRPGERILDLACGTGLVSFAAADVVGPYGKVVGLDVTEQMINRARHQQERPHSVEYNRRLSFFQSDILHLDSSPALANERGAFDVIIISSALVLFPDPAQLLQLCLPYLKQGTGRIAVDVPHPRNLMAGAIIERVAMDLGVTVPYYRRWITSEESLRELLERVGLHVEKIASVDRGGDRNPFYSVDDADKVFEEVIAGEACLEIRAAGAVDKAKELFKLKWRESALDGKVEEVNTVIFALARLKSDDSSEDESSILVRGGCRCGNVQYTCTSPPEELCFCHCRTCQQVSGAGSLPFVHFPTNSITYFKDSSLTKLRISADNERGFCSSCGSPIYMKAFSQLDRAGMTVGSIDMESVRCEWPSKGKHIFLEEKAAWDIVPNDGLERFIRFSWDGEWKE